MKSLKSLQGTFESFLESTPLELFLDALDSFICKPCFNYLKRSKKTMPLAHTVHLQGAT